MVYSIYILIIILNLYKKNSKVLFILTLIIMWVFFAGSYGNADMITYMNRYENYDSIPTLESGFKYLCLIGNKIGLNYQQFLMVVSAISLSILYNTVKKLTPNYSMVIALYCIYPFMMDVVQIRQFIATTIIIFGLPYFCDTKRNSNLKFLICIVLATTVHYSTILYVLLFIAKKFKLKQVLKITLLSIILLLFIYKTNFVYIIGWLIGASDKVSQTINATSVAYSTTSIFVYSLEVIIYFIIIVFIQTYLYKKIKSNITLNVNKESALRLLYLAIKTNVIMLILIPLLFYSCDLYRIQHGLFIFNYIACSLGIKNSRKGEIVKSNILPIVLCIVFAFVNLYLWVMMTNTINTVYYPFFENNIFLRNSFN